ncbi:hypothetical protein G7046_g3955 [Stylonectria norvegica]|nr:hypothetical protein G7046_g3955 [Stylonectria norvegica]
MSSRSRDETFVNIEPVEPVEITVLSSDHELPRRNCMLNSDGHLPIDSAINSTRLSQSNVGNDVITDPIQAEQLPLPQSWRSMLFPSVQKRVDALDTLHPEPVLITFMWQKYLDVVDPVLKMFHVPTIQRLVICVTQRRSNLDTATECLMFAIYYCVVATMSSASCENDLRETKTVLLKRYRAGLEQALINANFLRSHDLTVLQALVLYLTCGRRDRNGPNVYALIGVAIGNAMKMGLHCNEPAIGISTFDLEMRRRVWWHICTLDVRIAEDHEAEPSILEATFDTKLPLNVHDISLHPDMGGLPSSRDERTEMLFCLVRFSGSYFARRMVFSDEFCRANSYPILTEAQKCQAIDDFSDFIEKQYLSHCDMDVPIDFVTAASMRLILLKLKLAVCKPTVVQSREIPIRANYQKVCWDVLQQAYALRRYEKGRRWLWLFQTYVEWDAMAYLLLDMCISPLQDTNPEMWQAFDEIFQYWKNNVDIYHDRRWQHIEKLRGRALTRRATHESERMAKVTIIKNPGPQHPRSSLSVNSSTAATATTTEPHMPADHRTLTVESSCHSPSPVFEMRGPSVDHHYQTHNSSNTAKTLPLPGAGTACEWSASLFDQYWEVAGLGESGVTSWL